MKLWEWVRRPGESGRKSGETPSRPGGQVAIDIAFILLAFAVITMFIMKDGFINAHDIQAFPY